ncbi:MAG: metalloregulator ArsR/SmtB family transcription factor [Actinomycetota bacterium]|nr:metalloregulator ArsR/SmtB family transcription factor [Actinomycetota bacterium]
MKSLEAAEMINELDVLESPAACCTPLGAIGMSEEDAETTAEVFKALGDPNRVRIVNQLANAPSPVCVCDLTAGMELSQPTVSFHLKKLVSAGLLEREQRGVWAFYSINREALKRLATIFTMEEATV